MEINNLAENISMLQIEIGELIKQLSNELVPILKDIEKNCLNNLNNKLLDTSSSTKGLGDIIFKLGGFALDSFNMVGMLAGSIVDIGEAFDKVGKSMMSVFTTIKTAIEGCSLATLGIVAVLAGLAMLLGGMLFNSIQTYKTESQLLAETINEETEAVKKNAEAYKQLDEERENQIDGQLAELSYYESLFKELDTLIDMDGKIIEGNEERAAVITGILADALGLELEIVDQQIQGYGELSLSFEDMMAQKKAMLILESQESAYVEALQKKDGLIKSLSESESRLNAIKEESNDLELARAIALSENNYTEASNIERRMNDLNTEKVALEGNYKESLDAYNNYATTMTMYEDNFAKAQEGNYQEMATSIDDYNQKVQQGNSTSIEDYEKLIADTDLQLETLKTLKETHNTNVYDADIAYLENIKLANQEALNEQKEIVQMGVAAITDATVEGIDNRYEESINATDGFGGVGRNEVRAVADGITGAMGIITTANDILTEGLALDETAIENDAEKSGKAVPEGLEKGITNPALQSSVFSKTGIFANSLIRKINETWGIKSPSKVTRSMGNYLLEGIQLGIKDEEPTTLKQAQQFGSNIMDTMQEELNQSLAIPDVDKSIFTDVITDFSTSKYHNQTQSDLATLTGLLSKYLPYIADHSSKEIVLNDHTLVGKLAPKMDIALAGISTRKGRGM